MPFEELISLVKKKGFRETFEVLSKSDDYRLEMHEFYDELLKISYYNSFFRVKDPLIEKQILNEERENGKKFYSLTDKGVEIFNKLKDLEHLILNN